LAQLAVVGEGKHLRFRARRDGRDAGSAIGFGLGGQLERLRRPGRFDVAFRLQENHWNGMVAPQLVVRRVFDSSDRYAELRAWLAEEWRRPAEERDHEAQAVFDELELDGASAGKRELTESPTFRELLEAPSLARAA
jgi:hypothetical protein